MTVVIVGGQRQCLIAIRYEAIAGVRLRVELFDDEPHRLPPFLFATAEANPLADCEFVIDVRPQCLAVRFERIVDAIRPPMHVRQHREMRGVRRLGVGG